jgi:Sulfotransferase family
MPTRPFFLISGMFHSGTTLLARVLHAHPELAVASDPYSPLFKAFRNQVVCATEPGQAFDQNSPFGDYYFSPREQLFYDSIKNASLDRPFSVIKLFTLQEQIRQVSEKNSPKIHPYLDTLKGNNYTELLDSGVNILREAYGDAHSKMIGFKEVLTNEFIPHVLAEFSESKAIIVQRDPRAIAATTNSNSEKYPWIFLARQWRKMSSIAWSLTQKEYEHHDRVMLVKYESLIRRPKEIIEQICEFLNVPFDEKLLDPAQFVDGSGNPWTQNPSYVRGVKAFDPDSIGRWREKLSVRHCEFMERICWPEMSLFQYEPVVMQNWVLPEDVVNHPPLIPENELPESILPYSIVSKHAYVEELTKERVRWDALTDEQTVDEEKQKAYCLDTAVFRELRAIVRMPKAGLQARVVDEE